MITSITRSLAQQIVDTIHDVCGYNINFINTKGIIYASSDPDRLETYHEIGLRVASTGETIEVTSNKQYPGTNKGINIPIYYHKRIIAVVGISGEPAEVRKFAHLAERVAILLLHEQELNANHRTIDEKKQYLIRSVINSEYDNPDYLEDCFKEFALDKAKKYRVVMIEINKRYNLVNKSMLDLDVETLFSSVKSGIYIYNYPSDFIGIICDDSFAQEKYLLEAFARKHASIVKTAVGKATTMYECGESYSTAKSALRYLDRVDLDYVVFDDLTLEILLSAVPAKVVTEYSSKILSQLDEDEKDFLKVYYDNEMSLQDTADALFLHKNTVQQRLNKIMAKTGKNPRLFKDAVAMYLALVSSN
ncbi:MAG: helix-turn-helix domain-containing protein [Butyrivibrio sp.]|nr:helix-turn-helix domain-containing protein [Butyrivibrio sp.]